MTGWARWALATAVALLGAVAVPASASGGSIQTLALRFSFDGQAHGDMFNHLDIEGTADLRAGSYMAEVLVDVTHPKAPEVQDVSVIDLDQFDAIRAYGPTGSQDLCPGPPVCVVQGGHLGFGAGYSPNAQSGHVRLRYYLVLRAANIRYHVRDLAGWRPTRYVGSAERFMDSQSTGAGIDVAGFEASAMTNVSSTRTTAASIGIAVPPCDREGAGSLTLTGATNPMPINCNSEAAGAVAYGDTTWQLAGIAAGLSDTATRLLVITL